MDMPGLMSVLARLPLPPDAEKEIQKFLQISTPTARLMKKIKFSRLLCHHLGVSGRGVGRLCIIQARWNSPPCFPKVILRPVLYRPPAGYEYAVTYRYEDGEPIRKPASRIWLSFPEVIYCGLPGAENHPAWEFQELEELVELEEDPDMCREEIQNFQELLARVAK